MTDLSALIERVESESDTKPCENCGKLMRRLPQQFPYQWRKIRLCSKKCIGIAINRRRRNDPENLWEILKASVVIDPATRCWEPNRSLTSDGYTAIVSLKKKHAGHRVAYEAVNGPIPDGMCVCHRCDNRRCVNPEHLFLGTNAENTEDRDNKGRQARGSRAGRAKLTDEQVLAIRADRRPSRVVAEEYGIGQTAVSNIRSGRRWKHLRAIQESRT